VAARDDHERWALVEISRNDMSLMVEAAQRGLANTAPIPTILEKVIYHPEAIMLRVQPADVAHADSRGDEK